MIKINIKQSLLPSETWKITKKTLNVKQFPGKNSSIFWRIRIEDPWCIWCPFLCLNVIWRRSCSLSPTITSPWKDSLSICQRTIMVGWDTINIFGHTIERSQDLRILVARIRGGGTYKTYKASDIDEFRNLWRTLPNSYLKNGVQ